MLNIVTEKDGKAGAVLFRAIEPLEGIDVMKKLRGTSNVRALTSGPAKLVIAFDIGREFNRMTMSQSELQIEDAPLIPRSQIVAAPRVGIRLAKDLPYRYFIKNNHFVSVKK